MRTAILPFVFLFNTELLMIGIASWWHFVLVVVVALGACFTFVAATYRCFIVANRRWETREPGRYCGLSSKRVDCVLLMNQSNKA